MIKLMEKLTKFKELGLSSNTLHALAKKGFEEPTPIQAKIVPVLLKTDKDIIGQAQTGTGKTAAFGLPLIERIAKEEKSVKAIILSPTRELAIQVSEELNSLRGRKNLHIIPVYGGQSIDQQLGKLRRGVHIVVGTPGRVIDLINRKALKIQDLDFFILDEADEMLNMGFIEDIEKIMGSTNSDKQVLLFSATMPKEILEIAKKYMNDHEFISVTPKKMTLDLTDQIYFEVSRDDKFEALCRIIDVENEFYGIIFCRTKIDVDEVSNKLIDRGYDSEALHGDISQYQRERVLRKFKTQRINILVATDVAARGIDIANLTHVINYSLPQDSESYVHRIGRTGRAGKEGTAITFVTPSEYRRLIYIKRYANAEIRKESIPTVKEIISSKKLKIKQDMMELIKDNISGEYLDIAKELLAESDPEQVLASVLKYSFQDELNERNYNEIKEVSIDKKGKTRLFVAMGREAGIKGPKDLIEFITKHVKIDKQNIRDIKLLDSFSFVTVPFEEAEIILQSFKKKARGRRPVVAKAKEKSR